MWFFYKSALKEFSKCRTRKRSALRKSSDEIAFKSDSVSRRGSGNRELLSHKLPTPTRTIHVIRPSVIPIRCSSPWLSARMIYICVSTRICAYQFPIFELRKETWSLFLRDANDILNGGLISKFNIASFTTNTMLFPYRLLRSNDDSSPAR